MKGAAVAVLFAVLALIGGGLLAAAEFSTHYELVVGSPESQNFEDARARPAAGLDLWIAGGGLLMLAG